MPVSYGYPLPVYIGTIQLQQIPKGISMENKDIKNNPAFQNLSPEKLQFLMKFMGQPKTNNAKEMMALLMAFSSKAKGEGIQFSENETDFIIEHLKENMSPQEQQQTNLILNMLKINRKN